MSNSNQSEEKNYELIPSFTESLDSIVNVGTDFLELGIDSILRDGLLKDIPIVNTIVGLTKFGCGIREGKVI